MDQDQLKRLVAEAARDAVLALAPGQVLGIGTGSTANWFIDVLAPHKAHFSGVVSSSVASTQRLLKHGFYVIDANQVETLPAYVDGADEINPSGHMIKGGGGALTREKIVASLAKQFICICDDSKQVAILGHFPLPLEVIPLSEASVSRAMQVLGGTPRLRLMAGTSDPFVTDNGGWIIDVAGLTISDPVALESKINQIPGVITVGLFARQKADILFVGGANGVKRVDFS
jgi:ribose 5-phosphate isomerase A